MAYTGPCVSGPTGLILGPPSCLLKSGQWEQWAWCVGGVSGPWEAGVLWVMAIAVVEETTGTHAICVGVAGSCNGLDGLFPSPTAACSRAVGIILSVLWRPWSSLSLPQLAGDCCCVTLTLAQGWGTA